MDEIRLFCVQEYWFEMLILCYYRDMPKYNNIRFYI